MPRRAKCWRGRAAESPPSCAAVRRAGLRRSSVGYNRRSRRGPLSQPIPRTRCTIPVDPMADAADLAELFDVKVEQIARSGPLIAMRGPRGLQPLRCAKPQPAMLPYHGGHREPEIARGPERAPPPAPAFARIWRRWTRRAGRRAPGPRGAVLEPRDPLRLRSAGSISAGSAAKRDTPVASALRLAFQAAGARCTASARIWG